MASRVPDRVPIPKFANPCGTLSCELRNQRDTSKLMSLGRVLIRSQLYGNRWLMSALPPKADIDRRDSHVRFVPIAT